MQEKIPSIKSTQSKQVMRRRRLSMSFTFKRDCMNKFAIPALLLLAFFLLPGSASAADAEGTYNYVEDGYKGTMIITQMGPGFVFTFDTTSKSNGKQCQFETYETPMDEGGGREVDDLPAHGGTADDGIKFIITFDGDTAMVDVESVGAECGMSGYFGGKYVKAK